ncbi:MAG TPA: hypothetical protein VHG28_04765 [Longimicrobiaceae bacterium]|nr:hypothetical protein [Longimicrobiaceae bacterium]
MKAKLHDQGRPGGISKGKMLLGAAGLLLFIVGVRRTFRTESGREIEDLPYPEDQDEEEDEEDFEG